MKHDTSGAALTMQGIKDAADEMRATFAGLPGKFVLTPDEWSTLRVAPKGPQLVLPKSVIAELLMEAHPVAGSEVEGVLIRAVCEGRAERWGR